MTCFEEYFTIYGIDTAFYYDTKNHRYLISLNHGEKYFNFTKKEGETIIKFLKEFFDFLQQSKNSSTGKEK